MSEDVKTSARPRKARRGASVDTADELRSYLPYLLNRLTNRWNLDQNRDLADYGINNTMLRTLSVLHIFKTLTINEIATFAVVEQSNASRTIEAMASQGLVDRQISKTDLRRREIVLTGKGETLLGRLWPIMEQNYEGLTAGIDAEEIGVCARVLGRMIQNLGETSL